MRAVGVEELGHVPFVRHQVDPATVLGAWVAGGAAVVEGVRRLADGTARFVTGFGPEPDLPTLLAGVADRIEAPDRVLVTAPATAIPGAWPVTEVRRWHWMLTRTTPPPAGVAVEEVADEAEVTALLDTAAPDSHARPGAPGIEAWLGVREAGRLAAVGAVVRQPDGTGHLRAVTVAAGARGRGLGRELSVALTRRALRGGGVASLGVYVDNEPALRIYRGLGYAVVHSFTSGPVSVRDITTAVPQSR
jgi:ribosomal protein S18 acetylase RimI-like enzyme